jgi:hypothetical protein
MNKKILIILSIVIVAVIAIFSLYRASIFSKEILKLEILGPDIAKVGEEIEYTVQYKIFIYLTIVIYWNISKQFYLM